mmetsp:Transcript_80656/g.223108  ORF Transcript_80656/g.223108 Transcript_80656/m.223108 type:complete len:220 (+) Transcript_80656:34-693(+)
MAPILPMAHGALMSVNGDEDSQPRTPGCSPRDARTARPDGRKAAHLRRREGLLAHGAHLQGDPVQHAKATGVADLLVLYAKHCPHAAAQDLHCRNRCLQHGTLHDVVREQGDRHQCQHPRHAHGYIQTRSDAVGLGAEVALRHLVSLGRPTAHRSSCCGSCARLSNRPRRRRVRGCNCRGRCAQIGSSNSCAGLAMRPAILETQQAECQARVSSNAIAI